MAIDAVEAAGLSQVVVWVWMGYSHQILHDFYHFVGP